MAARGGRNNIVARRVIDDLIDISGERSPPKYLKIFIEQQITDHRRFIARMRDEIRTSTNLISQLNALIAELEASGDYEEVFDLVMELRDDRRDEQDKVADFNRLIAVAEEKIHGKEIDLEILLVGSLNGMECYVYGFIVHYFVVNGIMSGYEALSFECEAPLCLSVVVVGCAIGILCLIMIMIMKMGYQSEEYFDKMQEDDENNHSNGNAVKRGITTLYKFCKEYGKPDGIKLSKKVDSEARDKLWDEIMRYFDVDLIVRKLVMNRLGQLLRNFRRKLRQTYILPNQNTLSKLNEVQAKYSAILQAEEWVNFVKYTATEEYKVKSAAAKMARSKSVYQHTMGRDPKKETEPDEEPARSTLWLKGRVNKDGEYPDDEIRSVGDKLKETEDKIKEGTLKVDHGTDAMTVVLGKEKGGYAKGVGSGVRYKRYFDLPQSRQAYDERILLLQSQLDNEKSESQEKELLIQNLSNKMLQTDGIVTKLKNQLAAQRGHSADEEGRTTVVGCANDASIQKSNGLATFEKEIDTRTDGKQMLHNKELLKDCYKVSIDTYLVDAACILDVGNNGFKTVKDVVGGFFAWPKDLVVFDPKATPPSTIQMNVENKIAPKLHTKRKNVYVSSDEMQRQAKKKSLQKSLNY
ncbi:transposase, Ptta/En/Spm, transposase, Tnp1/En/Spm-like protein [Tanacetum coccineum]